MAQKSVASASARRQGLGGSRKALIGQTVTQTAPFNASRASLSWRVADCPPGSTEAAQKVQPTLSCNCNFALPTLLNDVAYMATLPLSRCSVGYLVQCICSASLCEQALHEGLKI